MLAIFDYDLGRTCRNALNDDDTRVLREMFGQNEFRAILRGDATQKYHGLSQCRPDTVEDSEYMIHNDIWHLQNRTHTGDQGLDGARFGASNLGEKAAHQLNPPS